MGVNDLATRWDKLGLLEQAADELEYEAKNCWHPVSEPPTDEDGDSRGYVLYMNVDFGAPAIWSAGIRVATSYIGDGVYWARIRDVVLLPPE